MKHFIKTTLVQPLAETGCSTPGLCSYLIFGREKRERCSNNQNSQSLYTAYGDLVLQAKAIGTKRLHGSPAFFLQIVLPYSSRSNQAKEIVFLEAFVNLGSQIWISIRIITVPSSLLPFIVPKWFLTIDEHWVMIFLPQKYHLLLKCSVQVNSCSIAIATDSWKLLPLINSYMKTVA